MFVIVTDTVGQRRAEDAVWRMAGNFSRQNQYQQTFVVINLPFIFVIHYGPKNSLTFITIAITLSTVNQFS